MEIVIKIIKYVQNYTYEHIFFNPRRKQCSKQHFWTHKHKIYIIIKTYNYSLDEDKEVDLEQILNMKKVDINDKSFIDKYR